MMKPLFDRIDILTEEKAVMLEAIKTLWADLVNNGEVLNTDSNRLAVLAKAIGFVEGIDPENVELFPGE